MDELLVAVLLRHHLLTAPLYLVELLPYALQRQAVELTPQRSCGSFYRRFPSLSLWFFCVSLFVLLPVGALFGAFYVGRLLPSLSVSACVRRPRFKRTADAMSAVDCIYLSVSLCVSA